MSRITNGYVGFKNAQWLIDEYRFNSELQTASQLANDVSSVCKNLLLSVD